MKRAVAAILVFLSLFAAGVARAEDGYWVQMEAHRTLGEAEASARRYAGNLDDVAGFRVGRQGWYAVALGPYSQAQAAQKLAALGARGAIPADSYIAAGTNYGRQFWPVGGSAPLASASAAPAPAAPAATEVLPEAAPAMPVEETRREALASERSLDGEARKALQIALKWDGFYTSAIDGDFGPGTRQAMAAWQSAQGYEDTGVLTTRQREELLSNYNNMLASMGLAPVTDTEAGITITLPLEMVKFTRYEAPFSHYEGDRGVRVVLISQKGDKATLYGLYDILQTLEVVPVDGPRKRRANDFTIEGANDRITSYTYATLTDGAVKGFMLIWPRGEKVTDPTTGAISYKTDRRRALVLDAMRKSFASTGAQALADDAGLDSATQSVDLMSGLQIRRAQKARSGFYVSADGAVLTTTEAVTGCGRVTLDDSYDATVTARDDGLGIALLSPVQKLAPMAVVRLDPVEPRLQSELAVAGYSYGGRLSAPTLTFGKLADVKGLAGEETIDRLEIHAQDGDTGGPVLDKSGAAVGMLLATPSGNGRLLPADVGFSAKSSALAEFLAANGATADETVTPAALTPYDLSALAAEFTVLVSCWK